MLRDYIWGGKSTTHTKNAKETHDCKHKSQETRSASASAGWVFSQDKLIHKLTNIHKITHTYKLKKQN